MENKEMYSEFDVKKLKAVALGYASSERIRVHTFDEHNINNGQSIDDILLLQCEVFSKNRVEIADLIMSESGCTVFNKTGDKIIETLYTDWREAWKQCYELGEQYRHISKVEI